jgi:hypothetical protein
MHHRSASWIIFSKFPLHLPRKENFVAMISFFIFLSAAGHQRIFSSLAVIFFMAISYAFSSSSAATIFPCHASWKSQMSANILISFLDNHSAWAIRIADSAVHN